MCDITECTSINRASPRHGGGEPWRQARASKSALAGGPGDVLLPEDMRGLNVIHKERKDAVRANYMFKDLGPGGKRDIGL